MRITMCGPAAAGKGTLARSVAAKRGLVHVDAGLIFRAAVHALQTGAVQQVSGLEFGSSSDWTYEWDGVRPDILYQGTSVKTTLTSSEVADQTSRLASDPRVLLDLIYVVNKVVVFLKDVVIDGRSAGTLLAPDADAKFYVDAAIDIRAYRRLQDLLPTNPGLTLSQVAHELHERDDRDRRRELDPLCMPEGAVVIDTTAIPIDDAVNLVLRHLEGGGG